MVAAVASASRQISHARVLQGGHTDYVGASAEQLVGLGAVEGERSGCRLGRVSDLPVIARQVQATVWSGVYTEAQAYRGEKVADTTVKP